MSQSPARAQRRKTARKKPTDSTTLKITVDGTVYILNLNEALEETTGRDALEVRKALGISLRKLFEAATDDPDIDVMCALVFLARRRTEHDLTLETVMDEITYGTDFDADAVDMGDVVEAKAMAAESNNALTDGEDDGPET